MHDTDPPDDRPTDPEITMVSSVYVDAPPSSRRFVWVYRDDGSIELVEAIELFL